VDTDDDPGPAIGTTGARFGGAPRRRRTARRRAAEADRRSGPAGEPAGPSASSEADTAAIPAAVPAVPVAPGDHPSGPGGPVVGMTGARFGGARRKRAPGPAPEIARPNPDAPPPRPPAPVVPPPPDVEEPISGGSAFVRPYVLTRGRTRTSFDLSIETLVSSDPQVAPAGLTGEHHTVLDLCREPRSVAELAAHAGVPLGVARVLVGDLAAAGAVTVHRAAGPDLALMRRVLSGLRKL
jgi:Protein of unknown function (DUF742)